MNDVFQFIANHLSLAISAHNSQPFKLKMESTNRWVLKHVPGRALPVADPVGKDHDMTAGAYVELIDILLGTKDHKIQDWAKNGKDIELNIVSHSDPTTKQDAIIKLDLAKKRFSFRGQGAEKRTLTNWPTTSYSKFIADEAVIDKIAKIYDDVNYRYLISPGYIDELYNWMRFKDSDPRYYKDGLNIEAMALNTFEALGASVVMKPPFFRGLSQIGVSKSLILEKDKTKSVSALLVIFAPKQTNFVEQGRLFFRAWLDMTALDFAGCPMSLLTDAEKEKDEIYSLLDMNPSQQVLVNVLRASVLPKNYKRYRPARLEAKEIIG